jgi:hypothetical protein
MPQIGFHLRNSVRPKNGLIGAIFFVVKAMLRIKRKNT